MRIKCPYCGWRSIEEFTVRGEVPPPRPAEDADTGEFVDYVYIDQNTRGRTREHWQHTGGCRMWLIVERDTVSHEIFSVIDAREVA
ncbi:MAG: sarcosine oxidase subunit delta [Pseudomonadota bacterium]